MYPQIQRQMVNDRIADMHRHAADAQLARAARESRRFRGERRQVVGGHLATVLRSLSALAHARPAPTRRPAI